MRACLPKRHEEKRERERQTLGPLAPFFICFFLLPLGLPYVNWTSQECCLFYLRSSLWSLDLPLTSLFSISRAFPFLVFQPLPFWTPVSYSNYLTYRKSYFLFRQKFLNDPFISMVIIGTRCCQFKWSFLPFWFECIIEQTNKQANKKNR